MNHRDIERLVREELSRTARAERWGGSPPDPSELSDVTIDRLGRQYQLRHAGLKIGLLSLSGPLRGRYITNEEGCAADFDRLHARFPELDSVYAVRHAFLRDEYRDLGLGRMMYERALLDAARNHAALMPDLCLSDPYDDVDQHDTSAAASRVWASLKRDYPHEGRVVYGRTA